MLKAILVGNLGRDPEEPRYTPEGRAFTSFNVASNYRARGQDGEWEDRTEWVRVRVFGRLAEVAMQHLHKGSRIYVDGKLEARPYKHEQSGEIRAGLELLANDLQFMSPRSDDDSGGQSRATPPREQSGEAPQPTRASGNRPAARDEDLEDLPF